MKQPFRLGVLTLVLAQAFPAWADETAAPVAVPAGEPVATVELEKIEVRARRPAGRLGESKTRRDKLDENLVQDVRDIVRYDPAVSVVEGGRGASNGFAIRGVDKDRVAVSVDGLAQAESRSSDAFQELFGAYGNFNANRNAGELENVAEVAIRKGADSLTVGSGALGGAVEYKTKSPAEVVDEDKPLYGSLKKGYTGRNGEHMTSLDVAGRLKGFDARIVHTYRKGRETENNADGNETYNVFLPGENRGTSRISFGSYGKLRTAPDPQEYRSKASLFKAGYHFNENNYLHGTYDEYRLDRQTDELSNLWGGFNGEQTNEMRRRNDVSYSKRQGIGYRNRLESGPWDELNVSFDKQDIQMSTMTWDVPVRLTETGGVNANLYYSFRRIKQQTDQWSAKAEKDLDFDRINWSMSYGLGGSRTRNTNDNHAAWVRAFRPDLYTSNLSDSEFLIEAESRKRHVFWNNIVRAGNWRIGAGVRYDWIKANTLPNEKYNRAMSQRGLKDAVAKFNKPSYALSLDWQFTPGWTVQGKYSTAFRAPTTDEMWLAFPHPDFNLKANPNLKAEQAKNIELGVAGSGKWGNVAVSGFHTRYKDFIELAYLGKGVLEYFDGKEGVFKNDPLNAESPVYQNLNRSSAKVNGLEMNGRWNLDSVGLPRGTFATLAASYQKGKTRQQDGSSTPMNALHPFGAVVGFGYEQPEKRWSVRTNISYSAAKKPADTMHSQDNPHSPWPYARHSKAYTLVDLSGHYNIGKHITLRAGVFNLFDKRYYTWDSLRSIREFGTVNRVDNCNNSRGVPQHEGCAHTGIQRFTAAGRNFVVGVQAKF